MSWPNLDAVCDHQEGWVGIAHYYSSKTDQYREGATVLIASAVPSSICLVQRSREYVELGGIDLSSSLRLFRGLVVTYSGERLRPSESISYTRVRELTLSRFQALGYLASLFGLRSFRASVAICGSQCRGYLTGYLSTMEGRDPSLPKTVTKNVCPGLIGVMFTGHYDPQSCGSY